MTEHRDSPREDASVSRNRGTFREQCYECGRHVEEPRTLHGHAYCNGCWYAWSVDHDSPHEVASLGWARAGTYLVLLVMGLYYLL